MSRPPKKPVKPNEPSKVVFKAVPHFYLYEGVTLDKIVEHANKHGISDLSKVEYDDDDYGDSCFLFPMLSTEKDPAVYEAELEKYEKDVEIYNKKNTEYLKWATQTEKDRLQKRLKKIRSQIDKLPKTVDVSDRDD